MVLFVKTQNVRCGWPNSREVSSERVRANVCAVGIGFEVTTLEESWNNKYRLRETAYRKNSGAMRWKGFGVSQTHRSF